VADGLPPVVQRFIADTTDYVAGIEAAVEANEALMQSIDEVIAKIAELDGALAAIPDRRIQVTVDTVGAGGAGTGGVAPDAQAAAEAVRDLTVAWTEEEAAQSAANAGARVFGRDVAASMAETEAQMRAYTQAVIQNAEIDRYIIENSAEQEAVGLARVRQAYADALGAIDPTTQAMDDLRATMQAANDVIAFNALATERAGTYQDILAVKAAAAGAAARGAAGGWTVFGARIGTVIHWVVAAGAEFLAVAIPAAVALGAAMFVAAQGAQMVQEHMSALYTATEATANMFHQTIGSALGLHSALQQAQNTANPIVWSVLGGVINILKGNFQDLAGVGLQVMRIFQTFTARVVADFQSGFGNQIHTLLSGMVTDLVAFGQILGNIGHALVNFAAAMPGLAKVLLALLDGFSQIVLWASRAPAVLITVAMAMEEIWRWGGPLVAILTRIPGLLVGLIASGFGIIPVFARIGEIFQTVALIVPELAAALGMGIAALGRFIPGAEAAGVALQGLSADAYTAIAGLTAMQAAFAGLAVAGIAFMIYKLSSAQTYTQRLAASMQEMTDKANGANIFPVITSNLEKLIPVQAQANQQMANANQEFTKYDGGMGKLAGVMAVARINTAAASAAVRQQSQDMVNASQSVAFLSHAYGVSFVGALELGTQAGVQWDQGIGRMSAAADINRLKVLDLMAGYKAMGQSAGAVGMDMTAIAIQSGLQTTKIQQLTQAWDSYMSLLTGGTNSLATYEQGLKNIGTVAASTAGSLFESTGKMNSSTQGFARSLQSFTGKGAQNWQNFNQVVSTGAEQFINWMQTAGAAGAVSGAQMSGAIKGIVAQLIPFASHSEAARAELVGLAAQTGDVVAPTTRALEAWAKGGDSAQQLAQFVQQATAKLSDMAGVAQALGNVMQNDLVAMFDKAKIAASGLPGALSTLSNAMHTNGTSAGVMQGDILQVISRLLALHTSLPTVSALLNSMGINLSVAGVKALIASGQLRQTGQAASTASGQMHGATSAAQALAAALNSLHSVNLTVTTSYINEGAPGLGGTGFKNVPHFASGATAAMSGLALVGEQGPELLQMAGGERIYPANQTAQLIGTPQAAAATGGFGGGGSANLHSNIVVNLDGKQIWQAMQTQTLKYNTRNSGSRTGKLVPGP
jgi:hypothetical protein